MTPELSPATDIPDWTVPYVLSGARVGDRSVYRFTPRCLKNEVMVMVMVVVQPIFDFSIWLVSCVVVFVHKSNPQSRVCAERHHDRLLIWTTEGQ